MDSTTPQPIRPLIPMTFRYPLHATADAFDPANPLLAGVLAGAPARVLVLLDDGVAEARPWLEEEIVQYFAAHERAIELAAWPVTLPGGEAAKTRPELLMEVWGLIHDHALCRHSYVLAVGGGAMLDMVGFAAATAHRGVRLVRMPTTVLAQNDAGVGVKNGINLFGKKNFLGTFAPPWAVVNDACFLETLSDRDWRAGTAEAVKVALLKDAAFFTWLEAAAPRLVRRDGPAMAQLIHRCAELHLAHIAEGGDPFEQGSSRPLDLGHWAAHKLEQLTHHRLRHGEAVAIGLALDATYAMLEGHLAAPDLGRLLALLEALGLPLYVPELESRLAAPEDPESLFSGLADFREHLGGPLTIPLPAGIGRPIEVHAMAPDRVRESIRFLARRPPTTKGEAPWIVSVQAP